MSAGQDISHLGTSNWEDGHRCAHTNGVGPQKRQPPGPDIADAPIDPRAIAGPEAIIVQRVMQWLERDSAPMHTVASLCKNDWLRATKMVAGLELGGGCPGGVRRERVPYSHFPYSVSVVPSISLSHSHLVDASPCRCRR